MARSIRHSTRGHLIRAIRRKLNGSTKNTTVAALCAFILIFSLSLSAILRPCPERPVRSASTLLSAIYDMSTPSSPSYAFFFTTGRSGTQHYSRILTSPDSFITHQQESLHTPTRQVVQRVYRPLASLRTLPTFEAQTRQHVLRHKLPFFRHVTATLHNRRFIYTGHLPLAFGLAPALLRALPRGSVRIVRAHRERLATALSLMALGPTHEDPWETPGTPDRRRWFPTPWDVFVRLRPTPEAWQQLNRFQRYLWYVDDVECRWQALKRQRESLPFDFMEVSLEMLERFDGGEGYRELATFLGVQVNKTALFSRHNTIQSKNREKESIAESTLRTWDEQYRGLIGPCKLDDNQSYGWTLD